MHTHINIQYLGMAQPGRNWNDASGDYRYGYNGKEEDNEIKANSTENGKSLDYGARWYDPRKARWDAVDPLEAKYPSFSPFIGIGNSPIILIDSDGEEVHMVFDKSTGKLHITDLDIYKAGAPTKIVSWREYKMDGIRNDKGEIIENQILEINGVFSGGRVDAGLRDNWGGIGNPIRNLMRQIPYRPDGSTLDNENSEYEIPIPNGTYDILYGKKSKNEKMNYFRLDPDDDVPFNNRYDKYGSPDDGRSGFLLHPGSISHGCVTINFCSPEYFSERNYEWGMVAAIMSKTTTDFVLTTGGKFSTLRNLFGKYGGTQREWFGKMHVISSNPANPDSVPDVTKDQNE